MQIILKPLVAFVAVNSKAMVTLFIVAPTLGWGGGGYVLRLKYSTYILSYLVCNHLTEEEKVICWLTLG